MTNKYWINLTVDDIAKSEYFFTKLGFSFSQEHGKNKDLAMLFMGDEYFVINFF